MIYVFFLEIEGEGLPTSPSGTAIFEKAFNFAALNKNVMFNYAMNYVRHSSHSQA